MFKSIRVKSFLAAVALVATLAACDAISGRETAGKYVDDATITSKVSAAIINDPMLKKSQVNVETLQNVVQLSGFVDSSASVNQAGRLAQDVKGVRSVRNDLVVR